jgi:hypothetical protein
MNRGATLDRAVDEREVVVAVDPVATHQQTALTAADVVDRQVIAIVVCVGECPSWQQRERPDAWDREVCC